MALAFFVMGAGAASAAPVDVYQGSLGASTEVVLELGAADVDGRRQGRYFYRRNGVDIPLSGKLDAFAEGLPLTNALVDTFGGPLGNGDFPLFADGQQRSVLWRARLDGDALVGEWVDGIRGKKLPFSLKHIAHYDPEKIANQTVDAVNLSYAQGASRGAAGGARISLRTTPYDFLRVSVPLEQGREVVLAPSLAWRPVRDARTKFWYPRLSRHPDATILAQANAVLEQRHWGMNLDALGCRGALYQNRAPDSGTLGNFENEEVKVSYLSPTLMSVVESGSIGCGGAHPHNHYDPFTLDLLRGGYLDFARILRGYRYADYAPQYGKSTLALVDKQVAKHDTKGDDTGCTDVLPEFMRVYFESPERLAFVVSGIPHAMGVCLGTGVRLRFAQLKPLLMPTAARYLYPSDAAPQGR